MGSIVYVDEVKSGHLYQGKAAITDNITVDSNQSAIMIGPVSLVNLTINGNLSVIDNLTATGSITIASNKKLRII